MTNADRTPEYAHTEQNVDPIAILTERKRRRDEKAAQAQAEKDARAAQTAQEAEENLKLVPGLVDQFFVKLDEVYPLLREADMPDLQEAQLVEVIDHDAVPSPQEAIEPAPQPKKPWYKRLFEPTVKLPAEFQDYLNRTPREVTTKQLACWGVTWINLLGSRPFVTVYIEVETGKVYSNSFNSGGTYYGWPYRIDEIKRSEMLALSYDEVMSLTSRLDSKIEHIKHVISNNKRMAELLRQS